MFHCPLSCFRVLVDSTRKAEQEVCLGTFGGQIGDIVGIKFFVIVTYGEGVKAKGRGPKLLLILSILHFIIQGGVPFLLW